VGLLAFLSGIDRRIFDDVYVPLGDVWDAAVIVNSAVNFILYCTMSAQFRCTFAEVICRRTPRTGGAQPARDAEQDMDRGLLVRWKLVLRTRTAPVPATLLLVWTWLNGARNILKTTKPGESNTTHSPREYILNENFGTKPMCSQIIVKL